MTPDHGPAPSVRARWKRPASIKSMRVLKDSVGAVGSDFGCRVQRIKRDRRKWLRKALHFINGVRIEARRFAADVRFVVTWYRSMKPVKAPAMIEAERRLTMIALVQGARGSGQWVNYTEEWRARKKVVSA